MKRVFPKPHPLSPNTKAIETDGKMYFVNRKGNTLAEGVKTRKSVYYWWFEYLRRNTKYRKACKGKKVNKEVTKVFNDFGNIFDFCSFDFTKPETQFSSALEFWKWWSNTAEFRNAKGAFLFSYEPAEIEPTFLEYNDVRLYKDEINNDDVKLIAISSCHSKSELRKKITKLLSKEFEQTQPLKREGKHAPNYNITGEVNIDVLKRDLLLWDARNRGVKGEELMDIYIQNSNLSDNEVKALSFSFKGIKNYLFGWELKDAATLEKEHGWITVDDDNDGYIPPELEKQISEQVAYASQNVFTENGMLHIGKNELEDARYMWVYVKLGLAQRTKRFNDCKRLRNRAYISINRSISRAEANINATGRGIFNLTTKEARQSMSHKATNKK